MLAYDADNPSSVVGSLRLARENARGLREILATEVWEALNRTYHELDNHVRAARTLGPHLLFQWVRDRVALVGGLIDTVLLHDDGWRFLTIGRCLERVDMTARLLGAVPATADASRWSGVLVSCGANDAFLRTYGGDIDQAKALSILLLDPDFPRSVNYALAQAEMCLEQVDGVHRPERPPPGPAPHQRGGPRGRPHPQRAGLHRPGRPGRRPPRHRGPPPGRLRLRQRAGHPALLPARQLHRVERGPAA